MISFFDGPSSVRRATWARVGGWEFIRVITICHRAWLAWRSPWGLGPVAFDLAGGGGDRRGGAQVRPGSLRPQPPGVVAGGDQQHGGGVRADAVPGEQAGGAGGHQRHDELARGGRVCWPGNWARRPSSRKDSRVW